MFRPALKIDENLPSEVLRLLRDAEHDTASVKEQALGGASDEILARVCRHERRALVTLDVGFADIRKYPPAQYAGIVVLRLARQDRRSVALALQRALGRCAGEELEGQLCIVTDSRIRRRAR